MEPSKLTTKSLVMWGGAVLLLTVIVVGAVKLASPESPSSTDTDADLDSVTELDWMRGSNDAQAILIEYSDFECPACAAYYPLIEEVISAYGDSLLFAYRHFPLTQHQQAKSAAYASEAAGKQGKFWEMHHIIFENQSQWAGKKNASELFESYAEEIGLVMEQYRTDVESDAVRDAVDEDFRGGLRANVNATPTFFLNGEKIQNPPSLEGFKRLIDASVSTTT